MPVTALLPRALAAAIAAQLTVAGVVVLGGGPQAEAAVALERAQVLATVRLDEREVRAAGVDAPVEVAADLVPAAVDDAPPLPTPTTPAPPPTAAPTTAPPPTAGPATAAPPTTTAPPPEAAPTTTAPPPPPPAERTQTSASGSWRDGACESSMLRWMDEARAGAGVGALADDAAIDQVAFGWSDHLAATGELAHNPRYSEQVFAARPEAMTAGEVVGRGADPRPVFDEFMRSAVHRDAILQPRFTHATVGCVRDAGGQVWVVANFWG